MSSSESGMAGTDSADPIISSGNWSTIEGGAGHDIMHGGSGNDQMWCLGCSDTIYGDAGDNTLYVTAHVICS